MGVGTADGLDVTKNGRQLARNLGFYPELEIS